jgi:hypothetical protein
MNWASWAIWGFAAITSDRDQAKWIGILIHLLNGYLFSLVYIAAFEVWGEAFWLKGALIGLVHSLFVLGVAMPNLPAIHGRMASDYYISDGLKQLEPPGFFAVNYGLSTPLAIVVAHIVFGGILGGFYQV